MALYPAMFILPVSRCILNITFQVRIKVCFFFGFSYILNENL